MLTVGDLLKKEREKQGYTLRDIERTTKIRSKYLSAVEANNWNIFPSKTYTTGIISTYAKHLKVDPAKAMAYFRRDYEKKEEIGFRHRIPSLHLLPETQKIIAVVISLICLFFLSYFGYQFYIFLSPPDVTIIAPEKRVFRNVDRIRIVGKTEDDAVVTIFDEKIFPNNEGRFSYELPLKKGKNPITITVVGANGKTTVVREEYILE